MNIAMPISAADGHLLETSVALLRHLGGLRNHVITLAPSRSQRDAAEAVADSLREIAERVDILQLDFEGEDMWPQSPNLHFTLTMDAIFRSGNQQPVFWKELDLDPLTSNWADAIELGWRAGRKPFYGRIAKKPIPGPNGTIRFEDDDLFMMGCGVYPYNMMAHPHAPNLFQGFHTGHNREAWDVYLRGWMRSLGWTASDIITDRWNTENYRYEGGILVCDARKTDLVHQNYKDNDATNAVVIHGCKDGSLARLIMAESAQVHTQPPALRPPAKPASKKGPGNQPTPTASSTKAAEDPYLDLLNEILGEIKTTNRRYDDMATLIAKNIHPREPEVAFLRGLVAQDSMPLADMARFLGMDKDELEGIIRRPESFMKISESGQVSLDIPKKE